MKTILWDFDGVILDSMEVRDNGFTTIFKDFGSENVEKLLDYHRLNGGLSRYVKIRYFYEKILGERISENEVTVLAERFSEIMRLELTNPKYLIPETVDFISQNKDNYNFHIVSGSDQKELRFLCQELGLTHFFISIHGSPTPKKILVKNLIVKYGYDQEKTCLIGDSINDFEAADDNRIHFLAYNNESLNHLSTIPTLFK